jgi:hypothetical protein
LRERAQHRVFRMEPLLDAVVGGGPFFLWIHGKGFNSGGAPRSNLTKQSAQMFDTGKAG